MHTFIPFTCDDQIIAIGQGLLDRTLPKSCWTHAAHFAAALWLLACHPDIDTPAAMPAMIRAYNESTGVANTESSGYHETITQASLRAARAFLREHPEAPLFVVCNQLMSSPLGRPEWLLTYWSRPASFPPRLVGCGSSLTYSHFLKGSYAEVTRRRSAKSGLAFPVTSTESSMITPRMDWKSKRIESTLEQALLEDKALTDITTAYTIDPALRASGTIIAKQDCVVAGLGSISRFLEIYNRLDKQTAHRFEVVHHPEIFDGVHVKRGQSLAVVRTTARVLLACERVILNLMQRMSGIATTTRQYVDQVAGTKVRVLDTRKTIPGLRLLDKYAVCCGGGENHRLDLSDGILIKNNHIALGGGIPRVLASALARRQPGQRVQVEVRTPRELNEALEGGAESLLLDNMTPDQVAASVKLVRDRGLDIPIEASGGITLENIRAYALAGPDYISSGALTHSAAAVDLSMRIVAEG